MNVTTRPQPFVKWAGGKRQLLPELNDRMPSTYNRYYEPFVGGGALLLKIGPNNAVINDINKALVSAYRDIQSRPDELMSVLDEIDSGLTKKSPKEHYYEIRSEFNSRIACEKYDLYTSAMFIYLNKHCFNGLYRVNAKGMFNVPCNGSTARSFCKDNIQAVSGALSNTVILDGDFEDAVAEAEAEDFIFFDSPYAPLNPTSFESYTKEGFSEEEHRRLAKLFRKLDARGCYCMLTNHNTDLINELYEGYEIDVVQVRRFINSDASSRKGTEVIIRNYR